MKERDERIKEKSFKEEWHRLGKITIDHFSGGKEWKVKKDEHKVEEGDLN